MQRYRLDIGLIQQAKSADPHGMWVMYEDAAEEIAALKAENERLRADAERWKGLYRRALNAANGLTNYVEDRPELRRIERELEAVENAARAGDGK